MNCVLFCPSCKERLQLAFEQFPAFSCTSCQESFSLSEQDHTSLKKLRTFLEQIEEVAPLFRDKKLSLSLDGKERVIPYSLLFTQFPSSIEIELAEKRETLFFQRTL